MRKQIITSAKKIASLEMMQQGTRQATAEKLDYTFYDTLRLLANIRDYRFFALALGQGNPPKTKAQTNMRSNAQIPQGHNHEVLEMHFGFTGNTIKTEAESLEFSQFLNTTSVTFNMPGKDDFGIWKLSELVGNFVRLAVSPAVAGDAYINNNSGIWNSRFKLMIPVVLPALETFEVSFDLFEDPPAGLIGDDMTFGLRGHLIRLN